MSASDTSQSAFLSSAASFLGTQGDAIGEIVDYLTGEDKSKFVFREKNTDDCWYGPTCDAIGALTPILVTTASEYTRTRALTDADAVVRAIFSEYKDQELPPIYQAMNSSGGYNSPVAQLLANDAFARVVAKTTKEKLDNVQRYSNVRQGDVQSLAQIYASTRGSYTIGSLGAGNAGGTAGGSMGGLFDIIGNIFNM